MQKISSISYQFIVILMSFSIFLTGCHSYYVIPKDSYSRVETMEDIKIIYKNGEEFIVETNDTTKVKIGEDSLVVYHGTKLKIIQMTEVDKIKEKRFDLGGTITISLVALTILVVLFLSMDPFKT
jgi:hypothetical protein